MNLPKFIFYVIEFQQSQQDSKYRLCASLIKSEKKTKSMASHINGIDITVSRGKSICQLELTG